MKSQIKFKYMISMLLIVVATISLSGCQFLESFVEGFEESYSHGESNVDANKTSTDNGGEFDKITSPRDTEPVESEGNPELEAIKVDRNGRYSSKMEVAAYIYQYGELPTNYLTKDEAMDLGWVASKGNLWKVTDQMSIGGNKFGNYEGLLPTQPGRQYYECDIDYQGGSRNAKRIVYSNDGLIFYTDDHYESFQQLN